VNPKLPRDEHSEAEREKGRVVTCKIHVLNEKNELFLGISIPHPCPLVPAPPAYLVASWGVLWHCTSCVVMAWACRRVLTLMPSSLSCGRAVALVMAAMVVSRGLGYLCYALGSPSTLKYGLWVMKKILSMYLIVIFSKNLPCCMWRFKQRPSGP
jgi:hypothetical protein